jgi:hypothetical protein
MAIPRRDGISYNNGTISRISGAIFFSVLGRINGDEFAYGSTSALGDISIVDIAVPGFRVVADGSLEKEEI